MTTVVTSIETFDGIKWFEISGIDYGTNYEFDGSEVFGVTEDGKLLDCDGCGIASNYLRGIAVRNALDNDEVKHDD